MTFIRNLFGNYMLMSAVCGWLSAQIIKSVVALVSKEKLTFLQILFSNGGMPSSHSASVMALWTAALIQEGVSSAIFAVTTLFAIIVMNDAVGVRYETGEQAKVLNHITKKLFSGEPEQINMGLKEMVGHTPFQVIMGALLGVGIGVGLGFAMRVILL